MQKEEKYLSKSPEETKKIAQKIANRLIGGEVIFLSGGLGSGKTVFAQGLINHFLPQARVVSPTFIIVRHYSVSGFQVKNIFHFDLYRLEKGQELENVGLKDFFAYPKSIFLFEWAEKFGEKFFSPKIKIDFQIRGKNSRQIKIIKF